MFFSLQVRSRSQKCGQNRPELICVDFWESYDPDEVCSSGFGLIGTGSFTIARLCFLCGSAGKDKVEFVALFYFISMTPDSILYLFPLLLTRK